MDEQVDRRAREHQEMDTWKYYDACHALSPLSSGSLGGHGSLELSALGRARAHLHTYTHTLTRRGCTYIALLCNDGNFFSLAHIPTPCISLSSLLPPTKNGSFLATRPIGPFHRHSLTLELLHWRSCLTQTRGGMAGARGSRKPSFSGLATNGGDEFGREAGVCGDG